MANFAKLLDKTMTEAKLGNEKLANEIENTTGVSITARTIRRWRSGETNRYGEPYTPREREYILAMIKPLRFAQKGQAGLEQCNALLRTIHELWELDKDEQNEYFPDLQDEPLLNAKPPSETEKENKPI